MERPANGDLTILNAGQARFECVYPVCGGGCCSNSRPAVEHDENERIESCLPAILPQLRPEVQDYLSRNPHTSLRIKDGLPTLAVVDHWCVFFNEGCVLHRIGVEQGDKLLYKPWRCTLFPLDRTSDGAWFVRQWGVQDEAWDLFCLNPQESSRPASETLLEEFALAAQVERRQFAKDADQQP